jgi:hypothetical protein
MSQATIILLAGALLALPACAQRRGGAQATGPIGCATPSPVDPVARAPVAGPLIFYGYSGKSTHAIVGDFEPGVPTKVGIGVIHTLTAPVTLEGWECATGEGLRFWYKECCPFPSTPVTTTQLASTGDLVAMLKSGAAQGYPGYMLFTRPGLWKVSVRQGDQVLGSVVLQVVEF